MSNFLLNFKCFKAHLSCLTVVSLNGIKFTYSFKKTFKTKYVDNKILYISNNYCTQIYLFIIIIIVFQLIKITFFKLHFPGFYNSKKKKSTSSLLQQNNIKLYSFYTNNLLKLHEKSKGRNCKRTRNKKDIKIVFFKTNSTIV